MDRKLTKDDDGTVLRGLKELDAEEDYFTRQTEFRQWLREEKGKYVDELSGEKARSYFKKFVKAWNNGKLQPAFYNGDLSRNSTSSSNTAYRWSFTSKRSAADQAALEAAKASVSEATYSALDAPPSEAPGNKRASRIGPTLPSTADRFLQLEDAREAEKRSAAVSRKRERQEDKERVDDLVGPREVGREGMLEKKRLKREDDRQMRDKDEGGLEVDDSALYGDKDSFRARLAARDAARKRAEEKKQASRPQPNTAVNERLSAMRDREKETMEHFRALAKQKFGGQ
ncbi:hypothetical protein FRB94_004746 [Tulasnella sp. JGI-2019a]|nr:hypothetical protein FRB93_011402 [Tulasnella sp. JGI-2019a]KAG9012936.1 hypothetical protein FRB94_004746 [Tulasnella sp. JGI-2019a]KAG9036688.1 hypothetical protein FRB95_008272 [Tulasnella sp. JGI-2019a]